MQFGAGLLEGELPLNGRALGVPTVLIGLDFPRERGDIRKTAIQTLAVQDTEFDFGHV